MNFQGKNIIWSDYLIREIYLSGNALMWIFVPPKIDLLNIKISMIWF